MGGKLPVIVALLALAGVSAAFTFQLTAGTSTAPDRDLSSSPGLEVHSIAPESPSNTFESNKSNSEGVLTHTSSSRQAQAPASNSEKEPFISEQPSKEELLAADRQQRLQIAMEQGKLNEFLAAEEEHKHKEEERKRLSEERIRYIREERLIRYKARQDYRERIRAGEEATMPDVSPSVIPEELRHTN